MLPSHIDYWAAQREQRLQLGDALDQPRQIDHMIRFKRKAGAAAAAERLEAAGYDVTVRESFLRTTVEASRVDALTEADVDRFLAEVVGIAEATGGLYDGFGGTIVVLPEG